MTRAAQDRCGAGLDTIQDGRLRQEQCGKACPGTE